jgi:hypothetical protein
MMTAPPGVFPLWHIVLTAATTAVITLVVLWWIRSVRSALPVFDVVLIALVAGGSVLLWRSVGNVPVLNNDPIPATSPNDVLCPLVTYLLVGMYAAFRPQISPGYFERLRVWIAVISLLVNIITI